MSRRLRSNGIRISFIGKTKMASTTRNGADAGDWGILECCDMTKSQNTKKATLSRFLVADEELFQQDKSCERKEDHISLKQGNTKCSDLFQDAMRKALTLQSRVTSNVC